MTGIGKKLYIIRQEGKIIAYDTKLNAIQDKLSCHYQTVIRKMRNKSKIISKEGAVSEKYKKKKPIQIISKHQIGKSNDKAFIVDQVIKYCKKNEVDIEEFFPLS